MAAAVEMIFTAEKLPAKRGQAMQLSADDLGSTRVSRVHFGVPPKCGEGFRHWEKLTDRLTFTPPSVSGGTPETTRETRVPPKTKTAPEKFQRGLKN